MKNVKLYEFNQSQDVVNLQCKYTLFKRIINIITSAETKNEIDIKTMNDAFNKVVERNDCLRIKFVKKHGQLMQYFAPKTDDINVPYFEFNTKEEQDEFFEKLKSKAIKYKKGIVYEAYFVKTFDNKFMVILKVCHLILDMYGINLIYKDLFEVYDALKNNTELPSLPAKFEDIVIKDLTKKHDKEYNEQNKEFFVNYFKDKEKPWYIGLHGDKLELWQKHLKKTNRPTMKMFFLQNKTDCALHKIESDVIEKAVKYCEENKYSFANLMMYAFTLCQAKINGSPKHTVQLELCNCRGTLQEKKAAGTKVQSLACYTSFDYDKSFNQNFKDFVENQNLLYRHIGYPDVEFEKLFNKQFSKPLLETYYACTFSLIPFVKIKDVDINVYSNGRFVLPSYIALMFDVENNEINMAYDFQKKIISKEDIEIFHKNYVKVLNQIMDNNEICLADVKVDY